MEAYGPNYPEFQHLRSCQAYNAQPGHYYTLTNQVKSLYVPPTHAASRAVKWRWHQRSCDESMIFVIGARRPLWRDEQQKMVVLPAAVGAISSTYLEWPVIRLGNVCDNDLFFLPLLHICYIVLVRKRLCGHGRHTSRSLAL